MRTQKAAFSTRQETEKFFLTFCRPVRPFHIECQVRIAAELFAFDKPQVVTSVVTQVGSALPGGQGDALGEFENASQALAAGYDVMHRGYLMQLANEKMRLKSTLEIRVRGNQFRDEILSEVQTDIVASLNHPVLLSFSTIGDRDSAIIVELKSGD